jgi:hypothetical protein
MKYHDGHTVDVLGRADVALLPALLPHHAEAADEAGGEDDGRETEHRVDTPDLLPDWVRHKHSHRLADADQNEVLGVLVAQFRYQQVGPVIDVLAA